MSFAGGYVRYERKEEVQNDTKDFGSSSWKEIVIILFCLTLLLVFSCPTFSVSIYSSLWTLTSQPKPEQKSSLLFSSTFRPIGCASCSCCCPYSPVLSTPKALGLLRTLCSSAVPLEQYRDYCCRRVHSTSGADHKTVCACCMNSLKMACGYKSMFERITQIPRFRETGKN